MLLRGSIVILLALVTTTATAGGVSAGKPNIVVFLADDLGYGDLACYGSESGQSPRLDRLAREGVRCTQFYASDCVCSPTRASLITGHFPGRHRIFGHLAFFGTNRQRNMPDWLDVAAPSLPRALQQAGYRTAMIGKWHLGGGSGRTFRMEDLERAPTAEALKSRPIVINHPDAPAVADYGFNHVRAIFGNGPTWKDARPWPEPHEIYPYACQEWTTWSSRAIADETIDFMKEHVATNSGQPFYANVWLHDAHIPMRPTEDMRKPFRHLEEKAQVHYAMVRFMDEQIGRVLDAMDELGLRNDTLVLFTSDNGAARSRGGSNGPLRGWKHGLYDGGIREPFIARWPGEIPAGRVDEKSVLNVCDLLPTFCKLAGAKMPEGYQPDGEDVIGALRGAPFVRTKPQFWYHPGTSPSLAVRVGEWKLLTDADGRMDELYRLTDDIAETTNLAGARPDIVKSLKDPLLKWSHELPRAPQ